MEGCTLNVLLFLNSSMFDGNIRLSVCKSFYLKQSLLLLFVWVSYNSHKAGNS